MSTRLMEPACKFGLEYLPDDKPDPVVQLHVENCPDCGQGEVSLL